MEVKNETLVIDQPQYKLVTEKGCFFIIDTYKERVVLYIDTVEKQMADLTGDKVKFYFYGEQDR